MTQHDRVGASAFQPFCEHHSNAIHWTPILACSQGHSMALTVLYVSRSPDSGGVKQFRGGLEFKPHRLLYHSTLGLRVRKKKTKTPIASQNAVFVTTRNPAKRDRASHFYRGTSIIRDSAPLGAYSRTMPRTLWWSQGGGSFL